MSKRLQVLMDEEEFDELQALAQRHGMTLAAWVRQALRDARRRLPREKRERRLSAIRTVLKRASELNPPSPSPDIDQMLKEIASGHYSELPK